jgi:RNA polymerase sigma factor (sigma-70 family)
MTELVKSVNNIRDEKAFYGFMWAVAGKVYAMWCRKKRNAYPLTDNLTEAADGFAIDNNGDLFLLRRELTLLSDKYRKAVILYYLESKSCRQISFSLGISESMVKHLLFKARKILKEGMDMERNFGEQSYNPKNLTLLYVGEGPNKFWEITGNKKIPQNIMWACYNDSLTAEEISLQIGVSLPYMEGEVKTLLDAGLLIKKGNRFSTNVIIFTDEFKADLAVKVEKKQEAVAETLHRFIVSNEEKLRSTGFHMNDMPFNSFAWHITCAVLWHLFDRIDVAFEDYPVTAFGEKAFVWGDESPSGVLNFNVMSKENGFLDEGEIRFFNYLPNSTHDPFNFYRNPKLANFYVKLAAGKVNNPNEYEKEFIADFIKHGYAVKNSGNITVTMPVYTKRQKGELDALLLPLAGELYAVAGEIQKAAEAVLRNHIPLHLKKQTYGIIRMRMFDDVIVAAIENKRRRDYLKPNWGAGELPTAYMVFE